MRHSLLLAFWGVVLGQALGQGLTPQEQECADNWFKGNPGLKARFSEGQVGWFCKNSEEWMTKATEVKTIMNDNRITAKEKDWLDELRGCKGLDCIKNVQCVDGSCKPKVEVESERPGFKFKPTRVFRMDAIQQKEVQELDPSTLMADFLIKDTSDENELGKKSVVAEVCIKVLSPDATPASAFPDSTLRPKQLQQRFTVWRSKCEALKGQVESTGASLDEIANPNLDLYEVDVGLDTRDDAAKTVGRRRRVATLCQRVLISTTGQQAFPDFAASNPTATQEDLQRKFAYSSIKCRAIKRRIDERGETWDEWVQKGAEDVDAGASGPAGGPSDVRPGWRQDVTNDRTSGRRGTTTRAKRQAPAPEKDMRAVRKEIRMLSDDERKRYFDALNSLKNDKIGDMTKYDLLTIYHTPDESPGAHWGPAFLPFHRELLKQ